MTYTDSTNGEQGPLEEGAEAIIRKSMGFAMIGGAIPIPIVDLTAVSAVQLDMLKQLAKHYEAPFDPRSSKAFLTSISGAVGGSLVARLGASVAKTIPGVGWAAGGVVQVVLTGASTYAVGRIVQRWFRENRHLADLNVDDVKEEYEDYVKEGKKVAEDIRKNKKKKDSEQI